MNARSSIYSDTGRLCVLVVAALVGAASGCGGSPSVLAEEQTLRLEDLPSEPAITSRVGGTINIVGRCVSVQELLTHLVKREGGYVNVSKELPVRITLYRTDLHIPPWQWIYEISNYVNLTVHVEGPAVTFEVLAPGRIDPFLTESEIRAKYVPEGELHVPSPEAATVAGGVLVVNGRFVPGPYEFRVEKAPEGDDYMLLINGARRVVMDRPKLRFVENVPDPLPDGFQFRIDESLENYVCDTMYPRLLKTVGREKALEAVVELMRSQPFYAEARLGEYGLPEARTPAFSWKPLITEGYDFDTGRRVKKVWTEPMVRADAEEIMQALRGNRLVVASCYGVDTYEERPIKEHFRESAALAGQVSLYELECRFHETLLDEVACREMAANIGPSADAFCAALAASVEGESATVPRRADSDGGKLVVITVSPEGRETARFDYGLSAEQRVLGLDETKQTVVTLDQSSSTRMTWPTVSYSYVTHGPEAYEEHNVRVIGTGPLYGTSQGGPGSPDNVALLSPDGGRIALGGGVVDLTANTIAATIRLSPTKGFDYLRGAWGWGPSGRLLGLEAWFPLTNPGPQAALRLRFMEYDTDARTERILWQGPNPAGRALPDARLAVTRDGKYAAVTMLTGGGGAYRPQLSVWDVESGEKVQAPAVLDMTWGPAWSPCDSQLGYLTAQVSPSSTAELRVARWAKGKLIASCSLPDIDGYAGPMGPVVWLGSRYICVPQWDMAHGSALAVLDAETCEPVTTIMVDFTADPLATADGSRIICEWRPAAPEGFTASRRGTDN